MDTSHISTISRRRRCLNDKQFNFKSFVESMHCNVQMCLHSCVFLSQIQGLADLQKIFQGNGLCFYTIAAFCVNGNKNMKSEKYQFSRW